MRRRTTLSCALLLALAAGALCGPALAGTHRRAKPRTRAAALAAVQEATETFSGTIANLRGRAIPGSQDDIMPVYVRQGEEIRRFVIRFAPTAGEQRTVVTSGGKTLSRDAAIA